MPGSGKDDAMMEEVSIRINPEPTEYKVAIGTNLLDSLRNYIEEKHGNKKIAVVTDENVSSLYEDSLLQKLKGLDVEVITLPAGEETKSRQAKDFVEGHMLDKKMGRDTLMVSFGGGVIGDLAGFVAATYLRGIPIIHLPTTLVAMADSSIGGKTAVNTPHGKNLIGSVWQPDAVFSDLQFLGEIPKEEFVNGMAEVIKIAATSDKKLFDFMNENAEKIMEKEEKPLVHIIKKAVELKKDVTQRDERESGLRQVLNFGHTVGHALELQSNYREKHGFCVSRGMAVETKIAELIGKFKKEDREKTLSLLEKVGLPTKIGSGIDAQNLMQLMESDKKSVQKKPRFVILKEIGRVKSEKNNYSFEVGGGVIKKSIDECKR